MRSKTVGNLFNAFAHKSNNIFGASVHRPFSSSRPIIKNIDPTSFGFAQGSSGSLDPYDPKVEKALENWYKLQNNPDSAVKNPQCNTQKTTEKTK